MKFTVFGGNGFIGSALVKKLRAENHDVFVPQRGDTGFLDRSLGHVIYAAGITADFRTRPIDTLHANVSLLAEVLKGDFESLLYLSSARIYRHSAATDETADIKVNPEDGEDYYDLTKLTAEALCHSMGRSGVRVVRLTNVVGPDFRSSNFLFDVIRSACDTGVVELRTAVESSKDYIAIEDVVDLLPVIALTGARRCYNVGSGTNLTHAQMMEPIISITGARLRVHEGAPTMKPSPVDIGRVVNEFSFVPSPVLPRIPMLVHEYMRRKNDQN